MCKSCGAYYAGFRIYETSLFPFFNTLCCSPGASYLLLPTLPLLYTTTLMTVSIDFWGLNRSLTKISSSFGGCGQADQCSTLQARCCSFRGLLLSSRHKTSRSCVISNVFKKLLVFCGLLHVMYAQTAHTIEGSSKSRAQRIITPRCDSGEIKYISLYLDIQT